VYGVFWDGNAVSLHTYDLAGNEKWMASLGGYVSQHGPGFSPVVHNGLVYVNVDDDKHAELIAFDTKTGDKKWTAPRKHERASYTPPFILERPGKPAELVLGTTTAITAYDPATGKVVWEFPMVWGKGSMPLRVIGQPVYAAGLVIMSCGDGGGARYAVAIDVDGLKPKKVWEHKKDVPYVPCMLVKDDLLYWVTDREAIACCAEAKTGRVLWSERVFQKDVTSSPVLVGDQILMISELGEAKVLKTGKTFEEVHKAKLGEAVMASPAIADGRLYVRGANHLFCFGRPK
jgi:outer membrane protein assembly factor BamB